MSGVGTPLGNMVIKLDLDDASFGRGVENSKKQIRYLGKEMQANVRIAGLAGNELGKLGTRLNGLTGIIKAQENQVASLKTAYDNSFVDGKPTESTKRLAAQLQDANGKLANYKQQLINTAGAYEELRVRTTGATGAINAGSEKLISLGKGMESAGSALTKGVTLPLAAGAAAVTKAAIDWESAFAGVKKTNDEVVDSNGNVVYSYADLESGLRTLATQLPSTHAEIANVAEAGGQLGIATENITGFTKTMIDLGESTNLSAEEAATSLARLANITGLPQTEFDRLGSAIVDLGNNFATTEAEITAMAMRLAGAGSVVGMSEADILGLSTALSSVGIEAESGGSSISKLMVQMQLASATGSDAFSELHAIAERNNIAWESVEQAVANGGKEMKEMSNALGLGNKGLNELYKSADEAEQSLDSFASVAGMSGAEFSKAFQEDAVGAIGKFIEGLSHAEEKGTTAIEILDEMGISEVRLRDALLRAGGASELFSDAITTSNKAFQENTALSEEAGKRYETTESKLKMLKNEVVDAAIDLGGPFVDALRDALESGKPLIKGLGDLAKAFSNADPEMQRTILKLIAATAAAGPLLSITGKLTGGIGSLGKSFVEVSASMAKKKAITSLTKELASGALSVDTLSVALGGGATKMGAFGSAASAAAGSSGLGAVAATLGPLGPAILGIVGAGGALAVGYGAWKLFGEEAWNSSQRVKQWGTDVGAVTDETLDKVQANTQEASGQFGLMEQGFATNSDAMVANFEKIGQTIEQSLIKKIEGLDRLIKELPESVDSSMRDMLSEEKAKAEDALKTVQENSDRIADIRKNASNNNRELSTSEAKIIQDLAKNTTEAYVQTLDVSAAEKKKILTAMTGDVSKASEEEASLWIQSLGKQRQAAQEHAAKSREEKEKYLEDLGYNLDGEFAQKFLSAWDEINKTTVDGFDAQIATITEKYPELVDEVYIANGQLISSMGDAGSAAIEANKEILLSANTMSNEVAKKAEENANKLAWAADESSKAGKKAAQTWNSLVFDEKTGEVKSNVRDVVTEATKDVTTWNNIKLVLHDANLDSNAKMIIGEAAIANGWWDGMAWEDKTAILKDDFSQTMYRALEDSGKWNELTVDEKTAVIRSNTPEVMAETMLNLGIWNDFQPGIKELNAKNEKFLQVLSTSEEKLQHWASVPVEVKEIIGENYEFLQKIYESEQSYNRWKEMPEAEKKILANNAEFLQTMLTSETKWNQWNSIPDDQKNMLANNEDLLNKVFSSQENYNAWLLLPDNLKKMMADNADLLEKISTGQIKLSEYDANNPALKQLLGDSFNIQEAARQGENAINTYKANNAPSKYLNGDSTSVQGAASQGGNAIDTFKANNAPDKYLIAHDDASQNAAAATAEVQEFGRQGDKSVTLTTTIKRIFETIGDAFGAEKGTNFHHGGDMIVNDQKGPLYRELVEFPDGRKFIPEGRDVYIPNAPKGTKVYTASRTKRMVPRYAKGVGVPENASVIKNLKEFSNTQSSTIVSIDNGQVVQAINELKEIINKNQYSDRPLNLNLRIGETGLKALGDSLAKAQGKDELILEQF